MSRLEVAFPDPKTAVLGSEGTPRSLQTSTTLVRVIEVLRLGAPPDGSPAEFLKIRYRITLIWTYSEKMIIDLSI